MLPFLLFPQNFDLLWCQPLGATKPAPSSLHNLCSLGYLNTENQLCEPNYSDLLQSTEMSIATVFWVCLIQSLLYFLLFGWNLLYFIQLQPLPQRAHKLLCISVSALCFNSQGSCQYHCCKSCTALSGASLPAAVRTCQCLLPWNLCCINLFKRFAPNVYCFPHQRRNKRFHAWHKHLARSWSDA